MDPAADALRAAIRRFAGRFDDRLELDIRQSLRAEWPGGPSDDGPSSATFDDAHGEFDARVESPADRRASRRGGSRRMT